MADITVTNTKILSKGIKYEAVANAADVDTVNGTQKFVITPNVGDEKTVIRVGVGAANGAVSASIKAGDFWMGGSALVVSCAQAKTSLIQLESAKYLQENGTYEITFTPATGKKLLTDHALTVEVDSLN